MILWKSNLFFFYLNYSPQYTEIRYITLWESNLYFLIILFCSCFTVSTSNFDILRSEDPTHFSVFIVIFCSVFAVRTSKFDTLHSGNSTFSFFSFFSTVYRNSIHYMVEIQPDFSVFLCWFCSLSTGSTSKFDKYT